MLTRRIGKDGVVTLLDTDSVNRIYELFFKNEKAKYLVVVDADGRPKGLIYRETVTGIGNASCAMDYVIKRMVTVDSNKETAEIDRMIFQLAKENINEVVSINRDGILEGIWEKNINDFSDFYEKYIFIKQVGYSLADWINYYYGENATIGIHSYSEYTELLLNEIHNTGIKVKFICQSGGNRRGAWGEIFEKPFSDITEEELSACDLVINTFMS
ncbi:MAG: hypothetical protein MRZ65_11300 [Lachnospiraceae bacterium]|nr:hypothetical protein [Lachnospiraceae bacterium]